MQLNYAFVFRFFSEFVIINSIGWPLGTSAPAPNFRWVQDHNRFFMSMALAQVAT